MAREIFSDVVRPPLRLGTRSWYTVPLSIAAHVLVGTIVIIVPLMAADVLPAPKTVLPVLLTPATPPPPPPAPAPPSRASTQPMPAVNPNVAPTSAPDAIAPEAALPVPPGPPGVEGGLPSDLATGAALVVTGLPTPPPAAPAPTGPVRAGSQIARPAKIKDVRPAYPEIAQRNRVSGRVMIEATIGANGRVINARIIRSVPLLDQAALDAVRQWEFTPTRLNGVAVPVIMTVTVDFVLQ